MSNRADLPEPKWYQSRNFNYLLASMLIPAGLITGYLFRNQLDGWLGKEPPISPHNSSSVESPQTNGGEGVDSPEVGTNQSSWEQGLGQAQQAAVLAQDAAFAEEWGAVASQWQQAIATLGQVTPDDDNYDNAQGKIAEYQQNLTYAQQNVTNPPLWINAIDHANQANQFLTTANTVDDWKLVASQWKQALDLLEAIPEGNPNYDQAQQKITEYEQNFAYALTQIPDGDPQSFVPIDPFQQAVNEAMAAATQVQTARSSQDWRGVIGHWQGAIAHLKTIQPQQFRYDVAQAKIIEYQQYLSYAEANLRQTGGGLTLKKTITGGLTPKSVVYSGNNLFFAQNMMYSHTVGIYNGEYQLVKTLSDQVNLNDYGHSDYPGNYQGSPVEATFSHGGKWGWISNYQMYGAGFNRPGADRCSPASNHDHSYVYRINTELLTIDQVIKVGAVPKFLAASPDDRYILVSNWCGYDVSVIDTELNQEIKRIDVGAYPRGIAITQDSRTAYVAIMGSNKIAKIDLGNFAVDYLTGVGRAPRHLVLDPVDNRYLYATLNSEGQVAQIDLTRDRVIKKARTGSAPRSMAISNDGEFLYVVNYRSNTMGKLRARDLQLLQTVPTNPDPIGITYNPDRGEVWVACYSGSLMVFQD